jgi:lipoprotein-anchoring transpeptidase ErfK/SrfK
MPFRPVFSILSATIAVGALATSANAQSRNWVPWAEIGSQPSPRAERPQAERPVAPVAQPRQRTARATPETAVGPAFREGGLRPAIGASTPPKVAFSGYAPGNVIVDTGGRALYYVLGGGQAYRYPISVGREGFTWRGSETISRVAYWPDWRPPAEMRARDPRLPEHMSGGLNNPLGAAALYLGSTLYRIHGTNNTQSIGSASSSGCFRMNNSHVMHLATLARPGTRVHVIDRLPRNVAGGPARSS